jgi:hypothetical protein
METGDRNTEKEEDDTLVVVRRALTKKENNSSVVSRDLHRDKRSISAIQ